MGSIYGSQPIGLLYFIGPWTLDPHLKWRLEPGGFFQSEAGIQIAPNPHWVSKLMIMGIKKILGFDI
jgi:hypothetical protein